MNQPGTAPPPWQPPTSPQPPPPPPTSPPPPYLGATPGPPDGGPAAPATRGGGWGRVFLVMALVGVLTLVASGAGGYSIARVATAQEGAAPVECDNRIFCVPTLPAESLVEMLTEQGFECRVHGDELSRTHTCDFMLGVTNYSAALGERDGLVSSFSSSVLYVSGSRTQTAEDYLVWWATMPFVHDPQAVEVATNWVMDNLDGGSNQEATIRGYFYRLDVELGTSVRLTVTGGAG